MSGTTRVQFSCGRYTTIEQVARSEAGAIPAPVPNLKNIKMRKYIFGIAMAVSTLICIFGCAGVTATNQQKYVWLMVAGGIALVTILKIEEKNK